MNANPETPQDEWPQSGRKRLILPSPIGTIGTDAPDIEAELFAEAQRGAVFMMGDNPALPRMPEKPDAARFLPPALRAHCAPPPCACPPGSRWNPGRAKK